METRVVHLVAQDLGYQRQSALIYEQMVFAAELDTIGRVSARRLAPRGRHTGSVNATLIHMWVLAVAAVAVWKRRGVRWRDEKRKVADGFQPCRAVLAVGRNAVSATATV